MSDRIRELATAIQDGSARPAEVQELAGLLLAEPDQRPLTDAELQALAGFAAVEECIAQRANHIRLMQNHGPAFGEDWESEGTTRLRAELKRRGVLP